MMVDACQGARAVLGERVLALESIPAASFVAEYTGDRPPAFLQALPADEQSAGQIGISQLGDVFRVSLACISERWTFAADKLAQPHTPAPALIMPCLPSSPSSPTNSDGFSRPDHAVMQSTAGQFAPI